MFRDAGTVLPMADWLDERVWTGMKKSEGDKQRHGSASKAEGSS